MCHSWSTYGGQSQGSCLPVFSFFTVCILGWSTGHQVWPLNPFTSRLPPHLSLSWNAITSMIWSWSGRQPTPTLFLSALQGFFFYLFFSVLKFFPQMKCHRSKAIIHKQGWGFQALPTRSVPLLQVLGIPLGSWPSLPSLVTLSLSVPASHILFSHSKR